jgi:hypothetical protein
MKRSSIHVLVASLVAALLVVSVVAPSTTIQVLTLASLVGCVVFLVLALGHTAQWLAAELRSLTRTS